MQECCMFFMQRKDISFWFRKKRSVQRNFIDFFVIVAVLLQPRRPWKVAFIPSIAATSTTVVDFIWFNFLDSLRGLPFSSSLLCDYNHDGPSIAATSTSVVDFIWCNFLDNEHISLLETPFRSSSNPYQASFFIHLLF